MQRKAFKGYNTKLKQKIENMGTSDRHFWSLINDISGLDSTRSSSAPNAEDIVDHFATYTNIKWQAFIDLEVLKSTPWGPAGDNPNPPPWQGMGWLLIMKCRVALGH